MKKNVWLLLLGFLVFLSSCSDMTQQEEKDEKLLTEALSSECIIWVKETDSTVFDINGWMVLPNKYYVRKHDTPLILVTDTANLSRINHQIDDGRAKWIYSEGLMVRDININTYGRVNAYVFGAESCIPSIKHKVEILF